MFHRGLPKAILAAAAATAVTASIAVTSSIATAAPRTAAPSSDFTLYTLPGSGESWVYSLINNAKSSIDLVMYEFQDTTAEHDLGAAASRGVDVRVILDKREQSENQTTYNYLKNHKVHVVWSSSTYYFTHEKSMVVDNTTAAIMTLNFQSQYYSTSRDFGVVDTDANDVAAMVTTFNADYAHKSVTPGAGDDLVWSPTTSQTDLLALINGATSSLRVYAEEMDDTTTTNALAAAAKRGVSVQIVAENEDGEYDSAFTTLVNAGAQVSYYSSSTGFYIHGKVIEADYNTANAKIFIGSQNFSDTSLNENRELGLIINDSAIESSVASTFASDFAGGTKWK